MQTQLSDGRQIDASFRPEEEGQTPAAVFRYSAIGPSARTGRKDRAPMSKTVPSTRIPNVMVSLGSVPMVSALRPWRAKWPASGTAVTLRDRGDTVRKPLTGCDLCVK